MESKNLNQISIDIPNYNGPLEVLLELAKTQKDVAHLNPRRRSNSNWTALYFGVSDMQVGGKYKATLGGSTWYFEPTHPMSKSGKIKGLLLSDSDRIPTIKFIGKKTNYEGLDWAEGSQFPQSVESKFNKKRNVRTWQN
mgnify:CR=1 FL=1